MANPTTRQNTVVGEKRNPTRGTTASTTSEDAKEKASQMLGRQAEAGHQQKRVKKKKVSTQSGGIFEPRMNVRTTRARKRHNKDKTRYHIYGSTLVHATAAHPGEKQVHHALRRPVLGIPLVPAKTVRREARDG